MSERRPLPMRRSCITFELPFGGLSKGHVVNIGFYPDGTVGECFVTGGKSGEQIEAIARDAAILISLALQSGVQLDTIEHAITRDAQGNPSSIVGAVIDKLCLEKAA